VPLTARYPSPGPSNTAARPPGVASRERCLPRSERPAAQATGLAPGRPRAPLRWPCKSPGGIGKVAAQLPGSQALLAGRCRVAPRSAIFPGWRRDLWGGGHIVQLAWRPRLPRPLNTFPKASSARGSRETTPANAFRDWRRSHEVTNGVDNGQPAGGRGQISPPRPAAQRRGPVLVR